MRTILLGAVAMIAASPAQAALLKAVRPSVMCEDPAALAKLALPQRGSRDPDATSNIARQGNCSPFPAGHVVKLETARHHTSIVTSDSMTGDGVSIVAVVANVDFMPYLPPRSQLTDLVRAKCSALLEAVAIAPAEPPTEDFIKTLPRTMQDAFAKEAQDCNPAAECDHIALDGIARRHLQTQWVNFLCAHPDEVEPHDASETKRPE